MKKEKETKIILVKQTKGKTGDRKSISKHLKCKRAKITLFKDWDSQSELKKVNCVLFTRDIT